MGNLATQRDGLGAVPNAYAGTQHNNRNISVKLLDTKFHENPFGPSSITCM
jgi:hypothetical protein